MRRIRILLPILSLVLLLAGCFPKEELKETSIVQAIGIDVGKEKDFAVTLQTYTPKTGGSGGSIDTSENNAGMLSGEGDTVSEAIHNAVMSGGKKLFTGYNRLIVLGRSLAEQSIQPIFSYFDRNTTTRQNVEVLMADGEAKEIVSIDIKEGILAAEMIEKMLGDRKQNGYISDMPYYSLSKNMYLYGGCAVLPLIEIVEEEEKQEGTIPSLQKVQATRSAVFSGYRLVGELDMEETRGSVLLHNQLEETVLVARQESGETASVQLYQCRQTLMPRIEDGVITFYSSVQATGTLDEVLEHNPDDTSFEAWEKSCERVLQQEMQKSFQKVVKQCHADVLYLGELVRRADPELWRELQKTGNSWLDEVSFESEVEVNINRIGMQTDREVVMK